MDILKKLPMELQKNVISYDIHPLAKLIKDLREDINYDDILDQDYFTLYQHWCYNDGIYPYPYITGLSQTYNFDF